MRSFEVAVLKTRAFIAVAEVVDAGMRRGAFEDWFEFDAMVMRVVDILKVKC